MKKIIYIVCSIFMLTIFDENINFIYAENDTLKNSELNEDLENHEWAYEINNENNDKSNSINWNDKNINENSMIENENIEVINPIDNTDDENLFEDNEIQGNLADENLDETIYQNNQDFSYDETIYQTFDYINQEIDTSDYGIIRIKDPDHPWKWITIHDRNLW